MRLEISTIEMRRTNPHLLTARQYEIVREAGNQVNDTSASTVKRRSHHGIAERASGTVSNDTDQVHIRSTPEMAVEALEQPLQPITVKPKHKTAVDGTTTTFNLWRRI